MEQPSGSPTLTATVVARLRRLRADRGLSARELAERCAAAGVPTLTRGTIAKIESRVRDFITLDELDALAKGLGVSTVELLGQAQASASADPQARSEPDLSERQSHGATIHVDEPLRGLWGLLEQPDRELLWSAGVIRQFASGEMIVTEGTHSEHVVILWSGFVKVFTRPEQGREVLLALRGPGDIVGEMPALQGSVRRSASVTAITTVSALVFAGRQFVNLLGRSPSLAAVLSRMLVDRLAEADRDRIAAMSMSVSQRLARLLLQLAQRFGTPTDDGGVKLSLSLSQRDLGAFVGGSARAVARTLESWRQGAIVDSGRRWLVVRRPEELQRIAGRDEEFDDARGRDFTAVHGSVAGEEQPGPPGTQSRDRPARRAVRDRLHRGGRASPDGGSP